jgi:hypothetical protein
MKFEIRHTKNGALLRVEHNNPEGEIEEIGYQETEGNEIEALAEFTRENVRSIHQ